MTTFTVTVPVLTIEYSLPAVSVYKYKVVEFGGAAAPISHVQDAHKLDSDAYVELFEVILADNATKIYLKDKNTLTWQGKTYQGTALKLEGVAAYSDEQTARPKFSIANPKGAYSKLADDGALDNAIIMRRRVLKTHIDSDTPISRTQQWRVTRPASVNSNILVLELRDLMDGQHFTTPARMFIPPEFPQVSLQ